MAADNNENIIIETAGLTAAVATDIAPFGGITSHFQLIKLAYGATGTANIVSDSSPLPVTVAAGLTATISGFTGTIQVQGVGGSPLPVSGTVYAVGLSGSPTYVATQSGTRVEVTGGRPTSRTTDSVSIFGPNGNTWAFVNIVDSSGSPLGNSGNPIHTFISGATVAVTVSATVGVTNDAAGNGLRIQGMSGGLAVATTVGNTVGINDTNIINGVTGIYNRLGLMGTTLDAIYNALSVFGLVRPTSASAGVVTATTSPGQFAGFTCTAGINIKALGTNTDLVYLGTSSVGSSYGYQIEPGESVFFNVGNTQIIYAQSKSGTQTLSFFAT
jgi:hypothetical protein